MGLIRPDKALWLCRWCGKRHLLRMKPGHSPMCTCLPVYVRMVPVVDTVVPCRGFSIRVTSNWGSHI